MRRAICHPERPNHDGKGRCWECADPNWSNQKVSEKKVNCIGDPLVLIAHPRRGLLICDEIIAPIVERLWRLGIDVESRESTHSRGPMGLSPLAMPDLNSEMARLRSA